MKVIIVEPEKKPYVKTIEEGLESMQCVVGGLIEMIMPFDNDLAIICNEEGKICGLPLNRAIYDTRGNIIDIIAGTFFICYAPYYSESFESIPESMIEECLSLFSL